MALKAAKRTTRVFIETVLILYFGTARLPGRIQLSFTQHCLGPPIRLEKLNDDPQVHLGPAIGKAQRMRLGATLPISWFSLSRSLEEGMPITLLLRKGKTPTFTVHISCGLSRLLYVPSKIIDELVPNAYDDFNEQDIDAAFSMAPSPTKDRTGSPIEESYIH